MGEQQQLSGTIVVIIIAMAVQVCIMLVVVVKRQIMRFALRNKRGPHTHVGQGAPKPLRRQIEQRLEFVHGVKYEPQLSVNFTSTSGTNRFRILALEEIRVLKSDLSPYSNRNEFGPNCNFRTFLLSFLSGPLKGIDSYLIHQVCDDYDLARHHFEEFSEDKFLILRSRIETLRQKIEVNKHTLIKGSSPKPPTRKREKSRSDSKHPKDSKALLVTSTNSANCTPV